MADRFSTWLVSYNMDGEKWSTQIVARDADDARRRLAHAAQWGEVDGEVIAEVPVWRGGFLIPVAVWLRNLFNR